jgi:hypothetical protein
MLFVVAGSAGLFLPDLPTIFMSRIRRVGLRSILPLIRDA